MLGTIAKGIEKDFEKARHWLRLAAEKDFTPNGLTRDSLEKIRTAAERGDVASQTYLAGCYARGILVPLDYDEALKWFRRAAILGDEKAKEAVRMLEKELGKSRDTGRVVPPLGGKIWYNTGLGTNANKVEQKWT